MRRALPWLRTVISIPLGVVAVSVFHKLVGALLPRLYGSDLSNDPDRLAMLALTVLAGIFASFVVAGIAQHRLWLHMGIFLIVMIAMDLPAVLGYLSPQPIWFKALIMLTLPMQAWLGGLMARVVFKRAYRPAV